MERSGHREKILAYLRGKDWVARSEITTKAFGGHVAAETINDTLQSMLADGEIEQHQTPKKGAARGFKTYYRIAQPSRAKDESFNADAKHAKHAKDSVVADFGDCERRAKDMRKTDAQDACREFV
jgi:hypothetical protein